MRFTMDGQEFQLDRTLVEARLAGRTPERLTTHWVEIGGRRWPPKQALEVALGVSRTRFTSKTALRHLRRLDFPASEHSTPAAGAPGPAEAARSTPVVAEDTPDPAEAFRLLAAVSGAEGLTSTIGWLESRLHGAESGAVGELADRSGLHSDVLAAALVVRRHMGRLNDVIHAATILQALPLVLEEGERISVRPSLAAGNDPSRPFDVETDRRVAEFKVAQWKGSDAMRQRTVFQDLVHLALDRSGRRAQLYVVGERPIKFLRTSTASTEWALGRSAPALRKRFEEEYGTARIEVGDFTRGHAGHVELVDLSTMIAPLV
ncbi:hypothetical protein [Nocardiopsis oceani]